MKQQYLFFLALLLIFYSCSESATKNQSQSNSDKTESDSVYFKEAQDVILFTTDSVLIMDGAYIFDTLCFLDVYNKDLLLDVLYTVDSTLSLSIRKSLLSDFEKYRYEDFYKFIPPNGNFTLAHIDSVGENHELFYTVPDINYKRTYLFGAPLFDSSYQMCWLYVISYAKIYYDNKRVTTINGYFNEFKKVNGVWEYKRRVKAPVRFDFAI